MKYLLELYRRTRLTGPVAGLLGPIIDFVQVLVSNIDLTETISDSVIVTETSS